MLGSATDAEDVLQDAWLRFSSAQPADLRSVKAYLTTIVTRLCLDRLKSARATREEYVGPWLPEPVVTDDRREPERSLALAESVTLAFMVLLETLSPEERAVFLLREVFDYEYDEIAGDARDDERPTAVSCFTARRDGSPSGSRGSAPRVDEKRPLVERFVRAFREGSEDGADRVLAEDVGFWSDGGGKVLAARRPVFGREQVVNLLVGFRRTAPAIGVPLESVTLDIVEVNGEPALRAARGRTARRRLRDDGGGRRHRRDPRGAKPGQADLHRAAARAH